MKLPAQMLCHRDVSVVYQESMTGGGRSAAFLARASRIAATRVMRRLSVSRFTID